MSDHPNTILLRDGYNAFAKGDMDFIRTLLAPDVVHRITGRSPISGEFRTPEEVLNLYGRLFEMSAGTYRNEPYAIMAGDTHGVAMLQVFAERAGRAGEPRRSLDGRCVDLFRFRYGKIVEIRSVAEDPYAVDEFWS